MGLFADRIAAIDSENAFKMGPHIQYLEENGQKVIKLNLGEPDFPLPSFIKDEIKHQLDLDNTHYCDPKGLLALRSALAKRLLHSRKIEVSAEQLVIFPGAKPGIGFAQQAYCNEGDEIIYPSPGFPIYESFIRYFGAKPVPLHLKEEAGFTFEAADLKKLISPKTKLIFLNFPSNPTGGVASAQQLKEISEVILNNAPKNIRVYSDEIYEDIIFTDQPHVSIASMPGMQDKTIISSGFSKSYAWTGGRLGYAVLPSIQEAEVFKNLNINYFSCVTPYNQAAAIVALEHPMAHSSIQNMVQQFKERAAGMTKYLNQIPGISCQAPKGAFYVFPNIKGICENLGLIEAFQKLAKPLQDKTSPSTIFQMFALYKHSVATLDRKSFGKIGIEGMHYLRLSAAANWPTLEQGLERLTAASIDQDGLHKFIKTHGHLF